jgi:hypothetical protein
LPRRSMIRRGKSRAMERSGGRKVPTKRVRGVQV